MTPILLGVHPSVPATDVKSLIALVKANPGKYTYGSSGVGSILHLCGEQFKALAGGLHIVHVPYRGSAPMMGDLVGGQISMAFDATPSAGLRRRPARSARSAAAWRSACARCPSCRPCRSRASRASSATPGTRSSRRRTPRRDRRRLDAAIKRRWTTRSVIKRLQEVGVDPTPGAAPKETAEFIKAELAKWAPIIKASGAQVE